MDIAALDLNLLKVFEQLARHRSVTLAGQALNLSQPAMSYALAKLRGQFGDPLFVRGSTGMTPTPRALALMAPVQDILANIRNAVLSGTAFDPSSSARLFTLSMSDIGELVFLPRLVQRFAKVAPDARIKVVTMPPRELEQALQNGEVDMAIGYFPDLTRAGFFQQTLFRQSFMNIVRTNHPAVGATLNLKQFLALSHAVVQAQGRSVEVFESALKARGLRRHVALNVPHFMSIPHIVAESDLVATVPEPVAHFFATFVSIRVLDIPLKGVKLDLRQHWHARNQRDPAHQWLRAQCADLFMTK